MIRRVRIFPYLKNQVFLTPAGLVTLVFFGISLGFYLSHEAITQTDFSIYLYSQSIALLGWLFCLRLQALLPRLLQICFALLLGLQSSFLIASNFWVYKEFRQFVGRDMVIFIKEDPVYLLNYVKTYLFGFNGLVFVVVTVIFFWIWFPKKKQPTKGSNVKRGAFLFFHLAFLLVFLNDIRHADARLKMPMDTAYFLGVKRSIEEVKSSSLFASFNREQPETIPFEKHWNLVH